MEVEGTGEKKDLFISEQQSAAMNWTPISGQSLLRELLEHIFQLSFIQKESRSGTETTLWYEPKQAKRGQLGDSLQKHIPDLNWNAEVGAPCTGQPSCRTICCLALRLKQGGIESKPCALHI